MESHPTCATTGERCPVSGIWKVAGNYTTTAPVARGSVMPGYGEKKVLWTLLYPC